MTQSDRLILRALCLVAASNLWTPKRGDRTEELFALADGLLKGLETRESAEILAEYQRAHEKDPTYFR